MEVEKNDDSKPLIFSLSLDEWYCVSEFMDYKDIATVSNCCKEGNVIISQPAIWEKICRRYYNINMASMNNTSNTNTSPTTSSYKLHFRQFITKYGHSGPKYYLRTMRCWRMIKIWSKQYLPQLIKTFNKPANIDELDSLKTQICSKDMIQSNDYKHLSSYIIFLGECANGQDRKLSRLGLYGYYSFYNKCSSGHLLSISDATTYTKQVHDVYDINKNDGLFLFCAGIPTRDQLITIPCTTFLRITDGKILKITRDAEIMQLKRGGTNSFIDHLEFYIAQLVNNNYRIQGNVTDKDIGILRFPVKDNATSECLTKGILCRASPLFVSELSELSKSHFIFPYHIEIECPSNDTEDNKKNQQMILRCEQCPNQTHVLAERIWKIKDNNKPVETIQGPGLIGRFPKVFINQDLFQYESCSNQKCSKNGKMWGSFTFKRNINDIDNAFELEVKPYKLDIDECQWI